MAHNELISYTSGREMKRPIHFILLNDKYDSEYTCFTLCGEFEAINGNNFLTNCTCLKCFQLLRDILTMTSNQEIRTHISNNLPFKTLELFNPDENIMQETDEKGFPTEQARHHMDMKTIKEMYNIEDTSTPENIVDNIIFSNPASLEDYFQNVTRFWSSLGNPYPETVNFINSRIQDLT